MRRSMTAGPPAHADTSDSINVGCRLRCGHRRDRAALTRRGLGSSRARRLHLRVGVDLATDPQDQDCESHGDRCDQHQIRAHWLRRDRRRPSQRHPSFEDRATVTPHGRRCASQDARGIAGDRDGHDGRRPVDRYTSAAQHAVVRPTMPTPTATACGAGSRSRADQHRGLACDHPRLGARVVPHRGLEAGEHQHEQQRCQQDDRQRCATSIGIVGSRRSR